MAIAPESVPVIDAHGCVFRLLRALGLPFPMWQAASAGEIFAPDVPFAILGVYGDPDAREIAPVTRRMPTLVYQVMSRAHHDLASVGAFAVVHDRMEPHEIRHAIISALTRLG